MGLSFGDFDKACSTVALVVCPLLGDTEMGLEPSCYSRNVEINKTLIFQPATCFIHIAALIMTAIMVWHIRSKYTAVASLKIATGVVSTLEIDPKKMREALTPDMLATDLADYLVRKGIPFRETHHISGSAVRLSEEKKCQLSDLTLEELKKLSDKFEEDVVKVWEMEESVERRDAIGGTSRRAVKEQCDRIEKELQE